MVHSMTGFSSTDWIADDINFSLELKSVNGRGLDLRTRFPTGFEDLEKNVKSILGASIKRGNISLNLRMDLKESSKDFQINTNFLNSVFEADKIVQTEAKKKGISLAPSKVTDYLQIKGVFGPENFEEHNFEKLKKIIFLKFQDVLKDFLASRLAEGVELKNILLKNIEDISVLLKKTDNILAKRKKKYTAKLKENLIMITESVNQFDEGRIEQELALLAVKADVSEEIDRLHSHVINGTKIINSNGAKGRRLEFLLQELNREANTLCSKSNDIDLTEIGLELKLIVDRLREQVQNVE
jgi:uncharacterized protein (TIGR00255 family)